MVENTTSPGWKYPRQAGATLEQKRVALLAALSAIDCKKPPPDARTLQRIAREYMFEDKGLVWPVWQALANNSRTPAKVIRDLEQKQMWHIDILLVQHVNTSSAFLHRMKDLKPDIHGAHANSKGYDNNKELRTYAYKRLGLSAKDTDDD
jgi:hypothetical protein